MRVRTQRYCSSVAFWLQTSLVCYWVVLASGSFVQMFNWVQNKLYGKQEKKISNSGSDFTQRRWYAPFSPHVVSISQCFCAHLIYLLSFKSMGTSRCYENIENNIQVWSSYIRSLIRASVSERVFSWFIDIKISGSLIRISMQNRVPYASEDQFEGVSIVKISDRYRLQCHISWVLFSQ